MCYSFLNSLQSSFHPHHSSQTAFSKVTNGLHIAQSRRLSSGFSRPCRCFPHSWNAIFFPLLQSTLLVFSYLSVVTLRVTLFCQSFTYWHFLRFCPRLSFFSCYTLFLLEPFHLFSWLLQLSIHWWFSNFKLSDLSFLSWASELYIQLSRHLHLVVPQETYS